MLIPPQKFSATVLVQGWSGLYIQSHHVHTKSPEHTYFGSKLLMETNGHTDVIACVKIYYAHLVLCLLTNQQTN
jgi:hypothetical protein